MIKWQKNLFYESPLWTYSPSRESKSPGYVPENASNRVVALRKVSVRSSCVIDAGIPIKKKKSIIRVESKRARFEQLIFVAPPLPDADASCNKRQSSLSKTRFACTYRKTDVFEFH